MSKTANNNHNDILPCPFCGAKAYVFCNEEQNYCSRSFTTNFGIGCKTEDCYGQQDRDMAYFRSQQEAIEAWNKRADNS